MKTKRLLFATIYALLIVGFCSCAIKNRVTSVNNTFLEDVDITKTKSNLPFDHACVTPTVSKKDYSSVYFKPIRIDYLPKDNWHASASVLITSEDDYLSKAKEIAEYFHSEIIAKNDAIKDKRLQLVDVPGPNTIVVEIAITELELSHPIARAGALASPIPGTGSALSSISDPHVAFAARLTDSSTGVLLATAADRKFSPTRALDLNKFTVSSSAREIVSLWAESIAEGIQSDGFTKVEEKRFSLLPW